MALNMQQLKATFQDKRRAGIVDLLWQSSRIMQRLYFIPHNGLAYPYTQRSKLPGVGFRGLNQRFAATFGIVNPAVETLAIIGGKITTDSIAISLKGPAARVNEVTAQMQAAGKFFDKNFFKGDPTQTPNAFYGLEKRIANSQLLTNATNGDVADYNNFIRLLDAVEGPNEEKTLFINRQIRRDLSRDVGTDAGGRNVMDVGRQLTTFEGTPIVEVFYDEAEQPILPFNESCGTSNVCSSAYCVKFGGETDEQGVQGISGLPGTIEMKGPYDYGETVEDVVQMLGGIGIFGGYVAARLRGITAAAA